MDKSVILLDGGMGQELVRRSAVAPTPLWATRILFDNPELVEELHIDFIRAGAKAIVPTTGPARNFTSNLISNRADIMRLGQTFVGAGSRPTSNGSGVFNPSNGRAF